MTETTVVRDERTQAVENSSYRLAYLVVSFGVLASVVYRSLVLGQTSWDLIGLVVLGGLVATVYQGSKGILTRQWVLTALITAVVAAALAAIAATVLTR